MSIAPATPHLIVVSGVSGVGKSVVGRALARRLAVAYADGDDFHTPDCKRKMAAGHALSEEDRSPWLGRIGAWLRQHQHTGAVVSCSALLRSHRDALRACLQAGAPPPHFLQLVGDPRLVRQRMEARRDHFMPASLLGSQLATLQLLEPDEQGLMLEVGTGTPEQLVHHFVAHLDAKQLAR